MSTLFDIVPEPTRSDFQHPQPLYQDGRYVCREELPWMPEFGKRALHPQAREVADYGETRRMECPLCGVSWTEELPQ